MARSFRSALFGVAVSLLAPVNLALWTSANEVPPLPPPYEFRAAHDPNGIGKFYFGREIAAVMGHQGADWLERPEREEEEKPELLMNALGLVPGEVVADIGAGTGYMSWRMADRTGKSGHVFAVDVQSQMLELLAGNMARRGILNVSPVLGSITNVALPAGSVDLALMVDVYHEFSHPFEMMQSICRSLKPGGRVVFVEFRAEDPSVPIKEVHKMSEDQVRKEMTTHPLIWTRTDRSLPWQHIIVFRKAGSSAKSP